MTSLDNKDWHGHEVLNLYRRRGKAEGHMGELKDTLNVHLSSTCRGASTVQDVMGRNQVNLLLDLYAYQLMHSLHTQSTRTNPESSGHRSCPYPSHNGAYRPLEQ